MSRLSLALLGPPKIAVDGAPVSLDRQKAVALLAYLAISGRRHGREALAALLWPDLPQERAYAGLRQAIWSLNSALGPGWVASDRTGVALAPGGGLDLDVAAFRAHLAAARQGDDLGPLRQAAALYRGDLLDGLDLRDSAPFAEWRFFEAEALRGELAGALDALAEGLGARGELEEAAGAARRRLVLDPLHEPAHRALMRIYAAGGQRSAALRQYEECARILEAEIGAAPDEETTALYQSIRAGAAPRHAHHDEPAERPSLRADRALASTGGAKMQLSERGVHSLPTPTTAFVGREAELAQIEALMADPGCRLLSLLGPGGIGKTRLAIEAARRAAPRFADGVCFVPLAPVLDPDLLLSAIADALGLDLFRREKVRDLLVDYLRPRALLLVADNLEHLTGAADQLAGLLEAAPGLTIITTSRERLAVPGEWTIDVGGLTLPAAEGADREAAAVQLFIQGARRATGGREPGDEEMAAVARICRLVGGTPLAIELAATWARLMPYGEIAASIARDLDFLAGSARGVPERHRGPRAVFEHSWRLLNPIDQGAFRRLAVFCGGFTREAAAAVLGLETWPAGNRQVLAAFLGPAAPPDNQQVALAALAALTDRSLVRQVGEGRYDVHELLRQYAAERLADDPADEAAARDAHAAYFLDLLRRQEGDLKGARQRAALAAIDADLDNVRCAWRRALEARSWGALAGSLESIFLFYEIESLHEEGEDAFGRAVAAAAAVPDPPDEVQVLLANLLARWGWFALRLYRFQPARAILDWSLDLIGRLGPRRETVFAEILASGQMLTGGRPDAGDRLRGLVERLRAFGDRWSLAFALNSLAYVAPTYAESEALLSESLALSRSIGDQQGIASCLDELAALAGDKAQMAKAVHYWEEALALYGEMGYRWAYAYCQDKLGYARRRMGDYAAAEALHRESLEGSRAIGDRLGVAGSLDNLGLVAIDRGDYAAAEALIREGLAIRRAIGHSGSTAVSYMSLASLEIARGNLAAAREALDTCVASADPDTRWLLARVQRIRARVALAERDPDAAWAYWRAALRLAYDSTSGYEIAVTLAGIAEARLLAGDGPLAAELAAAALAEGGEVLRVRRQAEAVLSQTGPAPTPRPLKELADELLA